MNLREIWKEDTILDAGGNRSARRKPARARLFPTVHYALNLRDAARNELERNMERRYDFRCRRKPKCSEKTCAGKYGSRTKFTYDSDPTGNRTRAALVKGTGTTAAPTCPPQKILMYLVWAWHCLCHNLCISCCKVCIGNFMRSPWSILIYIWCRK